MGGILDSLLERRLLVLSGKGGVGKSLVGAALATAARARGKKVLLVEIDAPLEAARYLGRPPAGGRETELEPGLFTLNLDPQGVMDEYVRHVVKFDLIARRILESPIYHRFFAAAPGLKELMLLGKIMTLVEERTSFPRRPRYDLVVVDAPATGHGLQFLKVPLAASRAVPVGPVGANARRILALLRDARRTALCLVAIPEEMAVVEAAELFRMASEEVGIPAAAVFLNGCPERVLDEADEAEVLRLSAAGAGGALGSGVRLEAALRAARRHIRRRKLARFYETRLRRSLPLPLVRLPFLFREEIGRDEVAVLAERLAAA
jgi:anion-transporting  ArsA/GET3 family ATPase